PDLIDSGTPDFATDGDRGADGRDEYDVSGLEPGIVARVASKQEIVEIEPRDRLPIPHQGNVAQRADLLHAAARIQGARHCRLRADRIRPGLLHIAEHEDLDRAQLP